ncbi:hypothetical protein niasHS_000496 [Heterodera schachtii]|uniref:EGF-like domain-containing protein n=1 Tax=Heterodera schachtii TaxID=97005 RepID=A0ABD2K4E2_HETSC
MRVDPNRIAARLRIEKKWDNDGRTEKAHDFGMGGRNRRQLIGGTPKEETIQVTAPLFSSRLFEFGPKLGDKELSGGIDMAKRMHLNHPITFFGHSHSTVWVLSNGGIGFDNGIKQYKPNVLPSMGQKLIAPFWNRNDLRNGGKVLFREVNGGRVLERGQSEIRYQYDREVKVVSAVVVTYEKMQPVGSSPLPDENTNSFQLVLFITSNGTFANFIYSNIGWTQGAEAGFNAGDGTNHFALPTSGTGNIMYLEEYGNTGIPGEWMFILEEERVVRCKAGIKGDTCDEACSPGEWGEDCVKCCHCAIGSCHEVSGECKSDGCARCWHGRDCQQRDGSCDAPRKCGKNAQPKVVTNIGTLGSRCGEPPQSQCECLPGYEGNAEESCADTDECAQQKHSCHEKAICTNTPGRFFCQCPEGYSGNGITECVLSFLYPFELSHRLPKDKNGRIEWQLKHPLKMFGRERHSVVITTNGLILVEGAKQLGTIASGEQPRLDELEVHGVAPFFAPIDLAQQGQIFVEETTDPSLLAKASRTINEKLTDSRQSPFEGSHALMVTYVNVSLANTESKFSNTFQTLLIAGRDKLKSENMTFVQFLYRDIAWSEGAEAGIMAPDKSSSILLPGSGTVGIEQLSQLSNVRSQGIWLFRVDLASLLPCMQPDLQPPYCDGRSPTLVNRLPPFHSTTPMMTTMAQTSAKSVEKTNEEETAQSKKGKAKATTAEFSGDEKETDEGEEEKDKGGKAAEEKQQKGSDKEKGGQKQQKILPQLEQIEEQTEWQPVREEEAKKETDDERAQQDGENERGKEKERQEEEGAKEKEGREHEQQKSAQSKKTTNAPGNAIEPAIISSRKPAIVTIQSKEIEEMPPDAFDDGSVRTAPTPRARQMEELEREIAGSIVPELIVPQVVVGGKRKGEDEEEKGDGGEKGNGKRKEEEGKGKEEKRDKEEQKGEGVEKENGKGKEEEEEGNGSKTSAFLQEKTDEHNANGNDKGTTNFKPKNEIRIEPIGTKGRTNAKAKPTAIPAEEAEEGREDEQRQQQAEEEPEQHETASSSAVPPSPPQRQRPTTPEAKRTARPTTEMATTEEQRETSKGKIDKERPTTQGTTPAEVSRTFILITNSTNKANSPSPSIKRTKATTTAPKVKPNNPDGDEPMLMEFDNGNSNNILAESAVHGNKLSVVVPVAIVLIWLVVLVVVAMFLCCRRRQTQERLRTLYGPAYQIRPVYTMRVNKLGSGNASYEEQLDKTAHRLSAEMAYNQNPFVPGRYSVYGSYWNISPQGSAVSRRNGGKATLNGTGPQQQQQNATRAQMAPLEISSPRGSSGDGSGGSSAFGNYIQSLAKMRGASNGIGGTEREDAQSEYFANSQVERNTNRFSSNNHGNGRI